MKQRISMVLHKGLSKLEYLWILFFVLFYSSCDQSNSDAPQPTQECLPTLSLSLETLEMTGDSLTVNYQVSGSGNYAVAEIVITTPDGLETISNPDIPYNHQVIFVDSPPPSHDTADIVAFGSVTNQGIIETSISYQIKVERNENTYTSGGVIRDKCQIK